MLYNKQKVNIMRHLIIAQTEAQFKQVCKLSIQGLVVEYRLNYKFPLSILKNVINYTQLQLLFPLPHP